MPYRQEPDKSEENRIPQMSKGSRRLMGLDTKQSKGLTNSRSTDNNLSSTNKLSTSDDDDEEYVLMYDAK